MNDFSILLNARVPFVPLIVLPIPALPAGDSGQGLHQFDHHHILSLLVGVPTVSDRPAWSRLVPCRPFPSIPAYNVLRTGDWQGSRGEF